MISTKKKSTICTDIDDLQLLGIIKKYNTLAGFKMSNQAFFVPTRKDCVCGSLCNSRCQQKALKIYLVTDSGLPCRISPFLCLSLQHLLCSDNKKFPPITAWCLHTFRSVSFKLLSRQSFVFCCSISSYNDYQSLNERCGCEQTLSVRCASQLVF